MDLNDLKLGYCSVKRYLCMTCRERSNGQVMIRMQSNNLPNYCPNIKYTDADDYSPISPPIRDYGIDIEVAWNQEVFREDGRITDKMVTDPTGTTDLLCSPGKYLEYDYKNPKIDFTMSYTFSEDGAPTNVPKEAFGIALNGVLLTQALTNSGQDPWNPHKGSGGVSDMCGTSIEEYHMYGDDTDDDSSK